MRGSAILQARFPYWHQFAGETERRPKGGGRTQVIWRRGGSERGLQVPRAVSGGVYQINRDIFVGL